MSRRQRMTMGTAMLALVLGIGRLAEGQTCQTTVAGGTYASDHWTLPGSPYCVTGDIQIQSLTIDPGVEVRADPGVSIQVTGTLSANGTSAQPILLTAKDPSRRWSGLLLAQTNGSSLTWCEIRLADSSGLQVLEAAPAISSCSFIDNTTAGSGGGLLIQLSDGRPIVLTDCVMRGNGAIVSGGGVRAELGGGSRLVLERCIITSNEANPRAGKRTKYAVGGGLDVRGDAVLVECDVSRNRCNGMDWSQSWCVNPIARGGGAFFADGDVTLEGCLFRENIVYAIENSVGGCETTTARGGGLYYDAAEGTLIAETSLFLGNHTWTLGTVGCNQGGGLYVNQGIALVDHCTIARNTPLRHSNGGSQCGSTDESGLAAGSATVSLTSSIVWNNTNESTPVGIEITGAVSATYSCIEGGYPGTGNLSTDPLFSGEGTTAPDVLLSAASPCIDAGLTLSGQDACSPPAKGGSRPDLGAFGGPSSCRTLWTLKPGIAMSGLFTRSDTSSPGSLTKVSYTVYATPAYAGKTAWVFLSGTGTTGFPLFGQQIPLTLDAWTLLSLNTGAAFSGVINADGVANTASFTMPGSAPVGRTFYAVGAVLDFAAVPPMSSLIQELDGPVKHSIWE